MKHYPPEFKADAVALYESRPEAMIRSVAADLGVTPETLRNRVRRPERVGPGDAGRRRRPGRPRRWKRRTRYLPPPVPPPLSSSRSCKRAAGLRARHGCCPLSIG
uniref:transposase n=1 Tax=Streptomyces sp. DG1A-41 TaxID=3125779 RepID=UPI0040402C7A